MPPIREPSPGQQTRRVEHVQHQPGGFGPPGSGSSAGRTAAIVLLLTSITLIAAGAGFLLAGGQLPFASTSPTPTAAVANTPAAPPIATQAAPTAPPAPTAAPTTPPKPTAAPAPAAAPPPTSAPAAPAAKPASASPAAPAGSFVPVRPGTDSRLAKIEGRVQEYFNALNAEDYARAHAVCCTEEWRARYPLETWQRNFDGVSDLRLVNAPRYQRVEDDIVVVDTDYTFVSGGTRRNFTLRWTFKPVGQEWRADLAEAFPTE